MTRVHAAALLAIAAACASGCAALRARPAADAGACPPATSGSISLPALRQTVVQAGDLAARWRLERLSSLPRGASSDGPSAGRLGGAVSFARRELQPWPAGFALTSSAELWPSPEAACRVFRRWRDAHAGADVDVQLLPEPGGVGEEAALLRSNEAAFGPMFEVLWHRGPVYATVQVQYPSAATRRAARAEAVRLARLQDRRLRSLLRGR